MFIFNKKKKSESDVKKRNEKYSLYIYTELFNLLTCHLLNFDILTLSLFKETDDKTT